MCDTRYNVVMRMIPYWLQKKLYYSAERAEKKTLIYFIWDQWLYVHNFGFGCGFPSAF